MEIITSFIGYTVITLGAIGLLANFFAIYFVEANDKINAEYLEEEKAKLVNYGP